MALIVLILGGAGFLEGMAVLVSQATGLECDAAAGCVRVERYPFGVERREPVRPFWRAETQSMGGRRKNALYLVLRHADESNTKYPGVGRNGEHAEETARALNAWLAHPEPRVFALRDGSRVAAAFLALLGLVGLTFISYFFSRVRLARAGEELLVTLERWPLPPKVQRAKLEQLRGLALRQTVVMGTASYRVVVEVEGAPDLELGVAYADPSLAQPKLQLVAGWFERQAPAARAAVG